MESTPRYNRPERKPIKRRDRVMLSVALLFFAGTMALVIGEVVLRLLPIPGIQYHSFYYDGVTGGKLYPNTRMIYRSSRGDVVRRRSNDWGFLDVDHKLAAPSGTYRIGFFGDSYTEARQVSTENTFVRLIENDLNQQVGMFSRHTNLRGQPVQRVETLAFGISGRSTLQSYLECLNWMESADLDLAVYVFVENDPGDQIPEIKKADVSPFAQLAGDSFVIDASFHERYGYKNSKIHRVWQFLKSNSLVLSTLEGRVKLLLKHGIKFDVTEADMEGGGGAGTSGMAPSSWRSDSLVTYGWTLTERVLDRWRHEVASEGLEFIIIRVPRESQLEIPLDAQDSWAPLLHDYCGSRGLALVDPTPELVAATHDGREPYFDHFTPAGHRAFADAFIDRLRLYLTSSRD